MSVWLYTLASTLVISLMGLLGVFSLYLSHERLRSWLLPLVGFAAGGLLGNAFFELLPELVEHEKGVLTPFSAFLVIVGIFLSFLLEQALRSYQGDHPHSHGHPPHLSHMAGCAEPEECGETGSVLHAKPFAVVDLIGDLVHNFIDGLVVGGAYLVSINLGITTALAVVLHEIPHELGNFAVLVQSGLTPKRALTFNFLAALLAVVGGVVALSVGEITRAFPLYLLPFTAGTFIYLAVGALIPELHAHGRGSQTAWAVAGMAAGVAVMGVLGLHPH